ncbi:MAG TPA: hypothetical protein DIV79_09380 [Opitutae bacterium]|nr:hypothetical protein [Opitutaceae bacterium]HCR30213.1 hypothetical protein [Opitutae bacterium]
MSFTGISVIVLTYKGRAQLENCLASVAEALRHSEDEIIVTEDGEDSKTCEIIRSISERFQSPIKHLTLAEPGRRLATLRNRGFLAAKNDIILFIDHDILLPLCFLDQLARYHKPAWVTACRRFFLNEKSTQMILSYRSPPSKAFSFCTKFNAIVGRWEGWRFLLPLRKRLPGGIPQSWRGAAGFGVAVSRRDFENVDGFDSRYDGVFGAEDWDLFARLEHVGVNFGYLPRKATVAHMHHPKAGHALTNRNYQFLGQVIATRRTQATSGLSKLV